MAKKPINKMNLDERVRHERIHGDFLSDKGAEDVWNWSTPAGMARAVRRASFFCDVLYPNAKALEFGCGTGYFTQITADSGANIIAVDLSQELLNEARLKLNLDNVTFEIADAHKLRYKSKTFDVIYGSSVLHHLDLLIALKESLRVLKPGGHFVFAEPNMLNPQIFAERKIPYLRKRLGVSPDETAFIRFLIAQDMARSGFHNIKIIPHEFLHPAIPHKLVNIGQHLTCFFRKNPFNKRNRRSLVDKRTKADEINNLHAPRIFTACSFSNRIILTELKCNFSELLLNSSSYYHFN